MREDDTVSYEVRHLPGSWAQFVKGLNKSMRDNVKYYPRLLAREGRVLVSGLTQLALGGRELLLERRDLLHQLRDRGDIDHRELGMRRARVA